MHSDGIACAVDILYGQSDNEDSLHASGACDGEQYDEEWNDYEFYDAFSVFVVYVE